MTYREFLKQLKKKAKKKGLLDAKMDETILGRPWEKVTYVNLIEPETGDSRHIKFGFKEGKRNHDGEVLLETKVIFEDF